MTTREQGGRVPAAEGSLEPTGASSADGDPRELVGTIVDRKYRVDRLVAEGGFGIVYEARHIALDVPVALKILRASLGPDPAALADLMSRLFQEANVLASLRGAGAVMVLDAGVSPIGRASGGVPWMALEWLDGETLRADLARRRGRGGRSRAATMALLRPVIETIAEAHARKIVHRDLKPSNIMLVPGKRGIEPRVLDFGIAKIMEAPEPRCGASGETSTASPLRAFTAASASPEQLAGTRTGPWTDVYALGLLLTEALTDEPAITARDPHELYRATFAPERPTPARRGVDVGPLEAVIARALAVRPRDRHEDARALLQELDAANADAEHAAKRRPARRWPFLAAAIASLATVAGGDAVSPSFGAQAVPTLAARPLVIVSELRVGDAGTQASRVAPAFAELLVEQLRVGDGLRVPDADTRAAMLAAAGFDARRPDVSPTLLTRLHADSGAELVVGGVITGEAPLVAEIDLHTAARAELVASVSVSEPSGDVRALVRAAGNAIRASVGRPAISAAEEREARAALPDSAEASIVYVEGLAAMRIFRFRDAAERFEVAHRMAPSFAPALAAMAQARLRLGELTRARELAEEAARLAVGLRRGDELGVHALAAETRHDWATAAEDYRALVRFYPDRVDYTIALARALVGAGKGAEAIDLLDDAKRRAGSDWDRMRLDLVQAYAYARQSRDPAAMDAAREAERHAAKVGARVPLAEAVFKQAYVHLRAGRLGDAEARFQRARATYVEANDAGSVLLCDAGFAEIAQARGDIARAIAIGEQLVAAHRASGNLYRLARETVSLGLVNASAGRYTAARGLFDAGGRTYIEAHDREGEAYRLLNLAVTDLALARLPGVADNARQGRAMQAEIKHTSGVAYADGALAQLAWYEGRFTDAEAIIDLAYTEGVEAKEAPVLAAIALDRARYAFERRSGAEAQRFADAERAVEAASDMRLFALLDVLASRRARARSDAHEAQRRAISAEQRARRAHAVDVLVLALAAGLDAGADGRDARRAELASLVDRTEAVEPVVEGLLALSRASSGAEAARLASRAHDAAQAHGLVSLTEATRRRLRAARGG